MWRRGWRDEIWSALDEDWDLLVIGGGITGAGILREATRLGLRTLLVEQRDFGWGTSSRSSKLVHGGLRYLKEGDLLLTRAAVREREHLLREGPGLIEPLGFLIANYEQAPPGRWACSAGLSLYDLLGRQWSHEYYNAQSFELLAPHINTEGLQGGFRYRDAQTDDARLVLRVLLEAVNAGGVALSYARAEEPLWKGGQVVGVRLRDGATERQAEVRARVVVNATGAWADRLRGQVGAPPRIRPLRGSHLIFPAWRVPVAQAINFPHPLDDRPVFIFPWEGITLVGTTDLDHEVPLDEEPWIAPQEVAYLMAALEALFPSLDLSLDDVISSFAGVRPVIGTGKDDPSEESRDHVVWEEEGLLTVTGGKLTTFRLIALDALRAVAHRLPETPPLSDDTAMLEPVEEELPAVQGLEADVRARLVGRYGRAAADLLAAAEPGELGAIPHTETLWAEARWAARAEGVVHLDDLLLRRTRLGLLLPRGAEDLLPWVRDLCRSELDWSAARWEQEATAYRALWDRCYSLPDRDRVPNWQLLLEEEGRRRESCPAVSRRQVVGTLTVAGGVAAGIAWGTRWLLRRRRGNGGSSEA